MRPTRCAAFFLATLLAAPSLRAAEPTTHASTTPATPATPAQVQMARDLFADASKDEEAQRWSDALEKLHRVAEVKLTASVRYHTAFCEEKLGRSATALVHYTEAQEAAVREHNKNVQELLKPPFLSDLHARVPTLAIEVPPEATGAEVTIDGHMQPPATWSTPVPFDPGVHRIEAHAPDRVPFLRDLALHEREVTVLDVSLPPSPVAHAASDAVALPAPAPVFSAQSATPPPLPVAKEETASASHPDASRPIGWAVGTTVGAVVLAGAGLGAFILAGNKQSDGAATCLGRTTGCDDLRGPVRTWDAVALTAWLGTAALATTAIVLWAAPGKAQTAGDLRLTATGSQLRLEGEF